MHATACMQSTLHSRPRLRFDGAVGGCDWLPAVPKAGHCFPVNKGVQPLAPSMQPPFAAGGMCSNNFFVDDGLPHLFAAVVDRRGVTVYRDPDWPGLSATAAPPATLSAVAPGRPASLAAPCLAGSGSCVLNSPACLLDSDPPDGQPDCRLSVDNPLDQHGFEPCPVISTPPAAEGLRTAAAAVESRRRLQPPPPPPDRSCCGGNGAELPSCGAHPRTLANLLPLQLLPLQLLPIGPSQRSRDRLARVSAEGHGPAAGLLCADALCGRLGRSNCSGANSTNPGARCVWAPPPAGSGTPSCGTVRAAKGPSARSSISAFCSRPLLCECVLAQLDHSACSPLTASAAWMAQGPDSD